MAESTLKKEKKVAKPKKSSKKEKTIAIFDIGSGSIGGAIIKVPFSKPSFLQKVFFP